MPEPILDSHPHLPAVFAAVVAMQLLARLYYGPWAFRQAWLRAWKLKPAAVRGTDPVPFVLSLAQAAVTAMSLDYLLRHLGWPGAWGGLRIGLYAWTGFMALGLAAHYRFARVSPRAWVLDAGFELLQLAAAGLILGVLR